MGGGLAHRGARDAHPLRGLHHRRHRQQLRERRGPHTGHQRGLTHEVGLVGADENHLRDICDTTYLHKGVNRMGVWRARFCPRGTTLPALKELYFS